MRSINLTALALLLTASVAAAPTAANPSEAARSELARRASLGVSPTIADGEVVIAAVQPGSAAQRGGLRPGDRLLAIDDAAITPSGLAGSLAGLRTGREVSLRIRRDGVESIVEVVPQERPREAYAGARTTYGSVPIPGGRLRDILVEPVSGEGGPVLFLLQGITCASIEAPVATETYAELAAHAVRLGWSFYRVEKPGVGDSAGGVPCEQRDFEAELEAFQRAYDHLIDGKGVAPSRIYLLGHSMGGVQAPFLARRRTPAGVIVYGTVVRNWADYHMDAALWQPFLYSGSPPSSGQEAASARKIVDAFFWDRLAPSEIAKATDAEEDAVREILGWDGGERSYGRHYRFLQSLARVSQADAWREVRSPVLSLYGRSDMVALDDADHTRLSELLNHGAPGRATLVIVPHADHDMRTVPDRAEFRRKVAASGKAPEGPFHAGVFQAIADWVAKGDSQRSLSRPAAK